MRNRSNQIQLMAKGIILFAVIIIITVLCTGCGNPDMTTHMAPAAEDPGQKLSFIAEFYDNEGENWLNMEGTSFDISPNKVKMYGYDSSGSWTYWYETSSVVSIDIDGQNIETCGSTVIFYDTQLEKLDIDIPQDITLSTGDSASIASPDDLRWRDHWTLNYWWYTKDVQNDTAGSRIVIIQSQEGDPICMFMGNEVTWDVSRNLPKTTEICIDGRMVYIHRANYAIVDASAIQ